MEREILVTFDAYVEGHKTRFAAGEVVDVPDDCAGSWEEKGLVRATDAQPATEEDHAPSIRPDPWL
jgi:hypothetical protein